jgi:hypothetical protein
MHRLLRDLPAEPSPTSGLPVNPETGNDPSTNAFPSQRFK